MYKVTYIVLSVYSGMLFFAYIPAIKFMLESGWSSSYDITMYTSYVWMTWIIKPFFGYLSDYYPICNKRITPYVVIASVVNMVVLGTASRLDLSKSYALFMLVVVTMFSCFSMIDAAARTLGSIRGHDLDHPRTRRETPKTYTILRAVSPNPRYHRPARNSTQPKKLLQELWILQFD